MALTARIRGGRARLGWAKARLRFDWLCDGSAQRNSDLHCKGIAVI
nr:MAG TPA: hypothetical protein [Caudoviricetes sp.]